MVEISYDLDKGYVAAAIIGDIDHHNAASMRDKIDIAIEEFKPATLILDFREVSFMDSSGIGLVMGRYRLVKSLGGNVVVRAVPGHIKKVMRLSGLDKIAKFID